MDFHQDDQLIVRAQCGDEEAFNALYEKYYKPMLFVAYRMTNNIEDAKDAVQAAFMQMYQSIANLKEPKYFRLWMNKIVRGKCIDMFHKNRDYVVDTTQDEVINAYAEERSEFVPHQRMKYTADQDILIHLLEELPPHYQEILFYAYFSQFSMKEMAGLLEIPEGTVKSRLYAAKKSLRDKVMKYEGLYQYKITFHMPGLYSLCLMMAFRKMAKMYGFVSKERYGSFRLSGKGALVGTGALVCVCGALTLCLSQANGDVPAMRLSNENINAQHAYFKLRGWAMDELQMSEKSLAEVDAVKEYYEYLKQVQGPYWERMRADHWDQAFEEIANHG